MKYLYIGVVNGLHNEMYNPQLDALLETDLQISSNRLEANNHFWSVIFNSQNISNLLDNISITEDINPAYLSILNYKDFFLEKVLEAQVRICYCNNSPQEFFTYLETLNLVCKLYSEYMYFPHTLTLQDGFITNNSNARIIWEECSNPAKNPYFTYIKQHVLPLIENDNPQLLFLEGAPNYYNMGLAKLIKQQIPNICICMTRHSSEYFSLNKLDYLLKKNHYFFKLVDIVILEFFFDIEKELILNIPLEQMDNILYKNKEGNIIQNKYSNSWNSKQISYEIRPQNKIADFQSNPAKLANVHLEPYTKCFWNKCSFCGINKKYHFENQLTNEALFTTRLDELKQLVLNGITYIWFIDEAIPVDKLKKLARFFIENQLSVIWQIRSRICQELTDDSLIELLEHAGLKEIRLGLESASLPILKKMNKFDESFSLDLVENICEKFVQRNISIHFPIIIGFPGETVYDRKCTYDFLRYLHQKYPMVTFNINLFGLDICSPMFTNWTSYEIANIYFPCIPDYYIANIVGWSGIDNFTSDLLSPERDKIMKDILYPWMPLNATLKPYIFYRLSETIRNTLYWKEKPIKEEKQLDKQSILLKNKNITISYQPNREIYIIYNWSNHHYMIGNENTLKVFHAFNSSDRVEDAIKKLCLIDSKLFRENDLMNLIYKLFSLDYLILK